MTPKNPAAANPVRRRVSPLAGEAGPVAPVAGPAGNTRDRERAPAVRRSPAGTGLTPGPATPGPEQAAVKAGQLRAGGHQTRPGKGDAVRQALPRPGPGP